MCYRFPSLNHYQKPNGLSAFGFSTDLEVEIGHTFAGHRSSSHPPYSRLSEVACLKYHLWATKRGGYVRNVYDAPFPREDGGAVLSCTCQLRLSRRGLRTLGSIFSMRSAVQPPLRQIRSSCKGTPARARSLATIILSIWAANSGSKGKTSIDSHKGKSNR